MRTRVEIPHQLSTDLEMRVELKAVLGVQPGRGTNLRGLDVLIQWKGLPPLEATWEPYNMIQQQFPIFHLEDNVRVLEGSNDRPPVYQTYQRCHKQQHA